MSRPDSFHPLARLLHWLMALAILAMLFVGVGMVATVSTRHQWLLAIHRPLGVTILLLALLRLGVRLRWRPPPLPSDMPTIMQWLAISSHWLLYALMIGMPLIGWAMLSAGGFPVMLGRSWHLPPILPANSALYAWLRLAHGVLAYLLFFTILGHMAAALYHGLIRRDGVLSSMTFHRLPRRRSPAPSTNTAPEAGDIGSPSQTDPPDSPGYGTPPL
ncbi:cytochrome b [Dyella solisilvae]|uniref:Cytochrome b n=1 Tax=Dyella solisilvae TaxID=1920168 RepID=A0A370K6H0_9GAMM|nr:cytochrome b [Dyella solisilvae]RDI98242.1 cytochrome b [Dyella solisilvae]